MKRDAARRTTGQWIRQERTARGLSPGDVAASLTGLGYPRSAVTIRAYEAGDRVPPDAVIAALASLWGSEPERDPYAGADPRLVAALRLVVREELHAFAGPLAASISELQRSLGASAVPPDADVERLERWAAPAATPPPRPIADRLATRE